MPITRHQSWLMSWRWSTPSLALSQESLLHFSQQWTATKKEGGCYLAKNFTENEQINSSNKPSILELFHLSQERIAAAKLTAEVKQEDFTDLRSILTLHYDKTCRKRSIFFRIAIFVASFFGFGLRAAYKNCLHALEQKESEWQQQKQEKNAAAAAPSSPKGQEDQKTSSANPPRNPKPPKVPAKTRKPPPVASLVVNRDDDKPSELPEWDVLDRALEDLLSEK